jgi:hypothetical protein
LISACEIFIGRLMRTTTWSSPLFDACAIKRRN